LVRHLNELAASLVAHLLAQNLSMSDQRRLLFVAEGLEIYRLAVTKLELEPLVPLVWQLFLKLRVWLTHEFTARLVRREKGR